MRGLTLALPMMAVLAAMSAGCTMSKSQADALRQENANLRAENAALQSEILALRQPKAEPVMPEAQAPRPILDPATRAELERMGIKVKDTGDSVTLTLPNTVLFASGSATLRASAKRALDHSASAIKTHLPEGTVVVEGHTDNQPIRRTKNLWKTNQQLSVARANAVAGHLRQAGIRSDRITVVGHGESRPVASNKTSQGRALNRRVEIYIKLGN